jgi:hypothetical protein
MLSQLQLDWPKLPLPLVTRPLPCNLPRLLTLAWLRQLLLLLIHL